MMRPTTLTVLGILAILFGALQVLCTPLSLLSLNNPMLKEFMPDFEGGYRLWIIVSATLGVLSALALLASGIGLLQVKEWARKLGVGLAVYYILFSFVGAAMQIVVMRPVMQRMMQDLAGTGAEQGAMMGGMVGGMIGGVFGVVISLVIYGLVIYFLTRPEIVTACRTEPVERAYAGSL